MITYPPAVEQDIKEAHKHGASTGLWITHAESHPGYREAKKSQALYQALAEARRLVIDIENAYLLCRAAERVVESV